MFEQHVMTDCEHDDHFCKGRYISWSAIVIGALVGIGLSFLLNVFGIAIGLSAFNAASTGATTMAIGGFIGMIIGTIASMFMAGWVTGYLSRTFSFHRNLGVLYGFSAWCLALVITIVLASSATHFLSSRNYSLSDPTSSIIRTTTDVGLPWFLSKP